jgi:hypothetical protein
MERLEYGGVLHVVRLAGLPEMSAAIHPATPIAVRWYNAARWESQPHLPAWRLKAAAGITWHERTIYGHSPDHLPGKTGPAIRAVLLRLSNMAVPSITTDEGNYMVFFQILV